jgi:hypothetical protein
MIWLRDVLIELKDYLKFEVHSQLWTNRAWQEVNKFSCYTAFRTFGFLLYGLLGVRINFLCACKHLTTCSGFEKVALFIIPTHS